MKNVLVRKKDLYENQGENFISLGKKKEELCGPEGGVRLRTARNEEERSLGFIRKKGTASLVKGWGSSPKSRNITSRIKKRGRP